MTLVIVPNRDQSNIEASRRGSRMSMFRREIVLVDKDASGPEFVKDRRRIGKKLQIGVHIHDYRAVRMPPLHMQEQRRRACPTKLANRARMSHGHQRFV